MGNTEEKHLQVITSRDSISLPPFFSVYSDDLATVTLSWIQTPLSPHHVLSLPVVRHPQDWVSQISLPQKGAHHCARLTRDFLKPGFWLF